MGARGPAPKRDAERVGHGSTQPADHVVVDGPVVVPKADKRWHAKARDWYLSLEPSGQSRYYEPSDWAKAHLIADGLSEYYTDVEVGVAFDENGRALQSRFASAATLKVLLSEMASLGVTESDRRRMRIEVERKLPAPPESEAREAVRANLRAL